MNTGRFALGCCSMILLSLAACGQGAPGCTNCPPLEGGYAFALGNGTLPSTCQGVTVTLPRGPLAVARVGGELTGNLDGLALNGTVYATGDFSLLGNRTGAQDGGTPGPQSASLSGHYVPALGDGGVARLEGEWLGSYETPPGGIGTTRRCSVTRPFTATRQ